MDSTSVHWLIPGNYKSTEDLYKKTKKTVDEKCSVLAKFDTLTSNIENLIASRNQAFLMSQLAIDANFKDHFPSGKFKNPVGEDFNERIDLIKDAHDKFNANPSKDAFSNIKELCGDYPTQTDPTGDRLLRGVENTLTIYFYRQENPEAAARAAQGARDAVAAETEPAPPPPHAEEITLDRIKDDVKSVVDDQIIKLKARTISQAAASDLAVQISNTADKTQQTILDEKLSIQMALAKTASHNAKIGGAVETHGDEIAKLETCNKEVKKTADEQYKKGLAEIDKLKKDMMEKVSEFKQNQQGQQGNRDWSQRPVDEIKREITSVKARLATPGIKQNEKEGKQKFLTKLEAILASKTTQTKSGGRRRVTMRRHRVY